MRAPLPLALLLLAITLVPAGTSGNILQGETPAKALWPFGPQLHCTILVESTAPHRCDVQGSLIDANEIRVTLRGTARVFVLLDDIADWPDVRQIASAFCTASCVVPFPRASVGNADLFIEVNGAPNTLASVSAGRGVAASLP